MDNLLVFLITTWVMYSISIGITGWCLGDLAKSKHNWRSLIPGWNVIYLFQLGGRSTREALLVTACFLLAPAIGVFLLIPLGGALMARTGRGRAWGFVLAFPPIGWLGMPIIGLSAKRFSIDDSKRNSTEAFFRGVARTLGSGSRWH